MRATTVVAPRRLLTPAFAGVLLAATLFAPGSASTASAAPVCDVPTPPPICRGFEGDYEDIPVQVSPDLALDRARQTTDRSGIHVVGWAADKDVPAQALSVQIKVDGSLVKTVTANVSRPDVAAVHPVYGAAHGYDTVVAAPATASRVCATAINVGSTGSNITRCADVDKVTEFAATSITYDTANAKILSGQLQQLDSISFENGTTLQQSRTHSGEGTVTETQTWSQSVGVKVTIKGGVQIPVIQGDWTVEGSYTFTQGGTTQTSRKWAWIQPLLVPPMSRVDMTVAVTKWTVEVPYRLSGAYVYASGAQVGGAINGTYHGVNSHNFVIKMRQYTLDDVLASNPVAQAAPSVSASVS